MAFLIATPEVVSAAATDLAGIGSTITAANTSAAAATTGVIPAALDEVSARIAAMFGAHGQAYQALSAQARLFHEQFVQALNACASAYANAEANVVQTLASAVRAPARAQAANPVGSLFQELETAQINFNTDLVNSELAFNHALVTNEIALEQRVF
ncbi:PE family protein, partial [Mycobacterium canetti]